MAVEFAVDLSEPVRLPTLMSTAASVLSELLGLHDPPDLDVVTASGHLRSPADGLRPATPDALDAIEVGPGRRSTAWEVVDETGATLVRPLVTPFAGDVRLTLEPRRDARGIVTALSLALATALLVDAPVVDTDLGLVGLTTTPAAFIRRWRLDPHDGTIGDASLRFLRRFEPTRDWPSH